MADRYDERHDREVIVERGGSSTGTVIAAIIGVLAIIFVLWMLFTGGEAGDGVENPLPDDVNVNIDDNTGGGGADTGDTGGEGGDTTS